MLSRCRPSPPSVNVPPLRLIVGAKARSASRVKAVAAAKGLGDGAGPAVVAEGHVAVLKDSEIVRDVELIAVGKGEDGGIEVAAVVLRQR